MRMWYLGNYKKECEFFLRVLTEDVKYEILDGSNWTPLMYLRVKVGLIIKSKIVI